MQLKSSPFYQQVISAVSSIYGVIALTVIVLLSAGLAVKQLHNQALNDANVSTQNLVNSMEQNIDRMIVSIDLSLLTSIDEITRQLLMGIGDISSINHYLKQQQTRLPYVAAIQATNEQGRVIYGTGSFTSEYNFNEDNNFTQFRNNASIGLLVSKPIISKISNSWVWTFARRINKTDDSFGGIVWIEVDIDEVRKLLTRIDIGPGDSIALRDDELGLIARSAGQFTESIPPRNTRLSTPFLDALNANRQKGTYISGTTSIDSHSRVHSYIQSSDYGFTINVGQSVESIIAKWHTQIGFIIGLLLAFILALLAFVRQTDFTIKQSARHVAELEQQQHKLRIAATAFESQEGMMITDVNNKIIQVNSAFTTITGYEAEDVIGKKPSILSSSQSTSSLYINMWEKLNSSNYWAGEIWNKKKSGEEYPQDLTITAVKNSEGIVTNYVATLTDITLSKNAKQEIENLAYYDSLTQLPNRRLMADRIKHAMSVSARNGQECALLFLDIDHFKKLNDTLGHDVGDILLQQVAERLTNCMREGDTIARFGGDEFIILMENLGVDSMNSATQVESIAHKIVDSIGEPYQLANHKYISGISIGISLFKGHESDIDSLLQQIDIAMYQSKDNGRNTFCFFDPQMQSSITERVKLESELQEAIEKQQFQLYYQIQVDSSQQPLGAEALIRWEHPERGIISPFYFIPLAEQTGAILAIGQWVLDTACAQLNLWQQDSQTRDFTLSVNVSAKQFGQMDFISRVQACIHKYDVNPSLLKLELTESLLLDNLEDTITKMELLAELGIQFSLDDFGTGYSSLQYLKRLPLDQIKIDQSFVRDLITDRNDQTIIRTIISMAHNLGLSVIAEGVETEQQYQFLLDEGCRNYQGYLFSKPIAIEEFNILLNNY